MKKELILIKVAVAIGFVLFSASSIDAKSIADFSNTSVSYYGDFDEFIGAKATGMGGTFIAIADDPLALYHNPAGLGQIKRTQVYFGLPHVSIIKPFRKFVIGIGACSLVSYEYHQISEDITDDTGISLFSMPISFKIFSNIYIGGRLNLFYKTRTIRYCLIGSEENDYHTTDEITERGHSWTGDFGALFKPFPYLAFGAIFSNRAKINWKTTGPEWDGRYEYIPPPADLWEKKEAPTIKGIDVLPPSFGVGILAKPFTHLLIASDVIYRKWSNACRKESNQEIELDLKDAVEFHLGLEYLTPVNIPLRFGLCTIPNYVLDEINDKRIFTTIGTGYSLKIKKIEFSFDIAVADSHLFSVGDRNKETKLAFAIIAKF